MTHFMRNFFDFIIHIRPVVSIALFPVVFGNHPIIQKCRSVRIFVPSMSNNKTIRRSIFVWIGGSSRYARTRHQVWRWLIPTGAKR